MANFDSGIFFIILAFCLISTEFGLKDAAASIVSGKELLLRSDYLVQWEVDEEKITFNLTVRTKGYIGFGMSPTGSMEGADIIIGGIGQDSLPYLHDYHGVGKVNPVLDDNQDYNLISGWESETHTSISFWRILNTCDKDDFSISVETQKLIWSIGETDELKYHSAMNRGVQSVNLMDPSINGVDLDQYEHWDMDINMPLPSADTTYWCSIYKTPNFTGNRHLVGFDIIPADEIAIRHTHHLDVYECNPDTPEAIERFESWVGDMGVDCYFPDPAKPKFPREYCILVEYSWAIGGLLTLFPNHTGIPFHSNHYYMMEVHYDNPNELDNVTLNTGMRLYYTDQLREYDAGFLLVASKVRHTLMIPPNSVNFHQVAHCNAACTNNFPEDGINVFMYFLHAHKSGRGIKIRLFRDGKEMEWIVNDEHYDFNYQQNRLLRQELKLYRGDHITLECLYDSTWKNGSTTMGARSTSDEMCQSVYFYYPKFSSSVYCESEISESTLHQFLGIEKLFIDTENADEDPIIQLPEKYKGLRYTEMIANNITWDEKKRDEYQHLHRYTEHEIHCFPLNPDRSKASYPNVPEFTPKNICTNSGDDGDHSAGSIIKFTSENYLLIMIATIIMHYQLI